MTETIDRNFLEIKSINDLKQSDTPKINHSIQLVNPTDFQINKFFYKNIGKNHRWTDRLIWSDSDWIKYVTNSTASSLTDRFQLYDLSQIEYNNDIYSFDDNLDGNSDYSISNPDFSFAQFNSNLVLRWEYIPGSELFLVWSQGLRNEFFASDSLIDGIQSGIIDQRPQNIFLIKFTYRFIL